MVNDRFKKDLLVKFDDCCKMSKKPQGCQPRGLDELAAAVRYHQGQGQPKATPDGVHSLIEGTTGWNG
jgi:hypothetical protein